MKKTPPPLNPPSKPQTSLLVMYLCAAILLGLDQWSKFWVVENLAFGQSVPALEPWLFFTYVRNTGAAFSILTGQKWLLSLIAIGVSLWLVFYAHSLKQRQLVHLLSLAAILAGALGNLTDRLRLGYVVDFFDLHHAGRNIWPIFNVADICINLGVALLILYFLLYPEEEEAAAEEKPTSHIT